MDIECVKLCDAINSIPGLQTYESCCGHDDLPFQIWFEVADHRTLPILLYFCDACHVGFNWNCKVKTDCAMSPVSFGIMSRCVGEEAYRQAEIIASEVQEFMNKSFNQFSDDFLMESK